MDPNPLQYQTPDENQPLYRAGLLSAGFVAVLIVLALGINYVIHHAGSNGPSVKRNQETSPDDTVNGMRRELSGEDSGTTSEVSGSFPTAGSMSASNQRFTFSGSVSEMGAGAPSPLMNGNNGPQTLDRHLPTVNPQNQGRSMPPIQVNAMRDWASIDPQNIDDLLAGR